MKKSLLIITLLVAVACLPATAQQLVKKRTSLSLVKKRAFGLPLKAVDATPQTLSNVVLGAYYPASASGVDGKENYYLVLADKADVTYSITEGTITATDAHVALLDLYAPEGNGISLPTGTFTADGDLQYDADLSCLLTYDDKGKDDGGVDINGGVTVSKTPAASENENDTYTVSFTADGMTYVYEGELSLTNMAGGSSSVYPQITTDMKGLQFTGGLAFYHGNLMESNTGNMIIDLYNGSHNENGGLTDKGVDLCINLYNRLFGDASKATLVPGTYTVARNFKQFTFFPGMEVDYMGITMIMGTYVKRRKAMTGSDDMDYDYCYIADGTVVIEEGDVEGTFNITVDLTTDRGHKVTGSGKNIAFPVTDLSQKGEKDVDSNLENDVDLNFDRVDKSRIYSLGVQNGVQVFSVDLGSPSGKDDPEKMGDQDLLRMEFQAPEGSGYLPEGTYRLMEESHLWTNLYGPYQLTRGYFDDLGGRTGTVYQHFMKCEYPGEHWWVVDSFATVYSGTVGVSRTDNDHYRFAIDLYDGHGFKISGVYDKVMEYHYDPASITAIKGVADDRQRQPMRIYTLDGQLLRSVDATNTTAVSALPAGIYVVKSGNTTTKIVKK